MWEEDSVSMFDTVFWIKFGVLWLIFSAVIWLTDFTDVGIKWKLIFTGAAGVGILLALSGKNLKGFSGRRTR